MPYVGPTALVRWMAGHDLAGPGALTEFDDTLMGKFADTTVLGPRGAIKSEGPLGCVEYMANETGFLDESEFSLRKLFGSGAPPVPWRSVVGHIGGTVGAECTIASDLRIKKKSIPPELEDFTKVALEYFLNEGGDVFEEALFLHGGGRVMHNPAAAPYVGARIDNGAASANGAAICLMIDTDAVWRGQTWVRVTVRHSATLLTTAWPALGTATLQLNAGSATPAQTLITIAGNVNRYLSVTWEWGVISAFRIDNPGGYGMGTTAMHMDGRTANESLQIGDVFRFAGDTTDHTVTGGGIAPTEAGSEFDVTFTPGTTFQNFGNNTVVTVRTKNDRSFKYIAAVKRL